jgi:hypothetical protein
LLGNDSVDFVVDESRAADTAEVFGLFVFLGGDFVGAVNQELLALDLSPDHPVDIRLEKGGILD